MILQQHIIYCKYLWIAFFEKTLEIICLKLVLFAFSEIEADSSSDILIIYNKEAKISSRYLIMAHAAYIQFNAESPKSQKFFFLLSPFFFFFLSLSLSPPY